MTDLEKLTRWERFRLRLHKWPFSSNRVEEITKSDVEMMLDFAGEWLARGDKYLRRKDYKNEDRYRSEFETRMEIMRKWRKEQEEQEMVRLRDEFKKVKPC